MATKPSVDELLDAAGEPLSLSLAWEPLSLPAVAGAGGGEEGEEAAVNGANCKTKSPKMEGQREREELEREGGGREVGE